jgi:hypothetical protein
MTTEAKLESTPAPERLCGFFVECEPGGLATRPCYSINYGPFPTCEDAIAFARQVKGRIVQWDLHLVSRHEMPHEEYEPEFAHLDHIVTPPEQN